MGRARDTRLGRYVAIKVLPEHIAARASSRLRFEREARIIAALNHPYICQIFDVGHQDGTDYLVMEFVEGETLARRLRHGPLPLDQMLRYGIQIAEALDQAHRREVIHRDLKPGNIMLARCASAHAHAGKEPLVDVYVSVPTRPAWRPVPGRHGREDTTASCADPPGKWRR